MPTIELHGTPEDIGWVLSVMTFPNDRALREQRFAVDLVRANLLSEVARADRMEVDRKTLQLLIDAPSYGDLQQMTAEAAKKAYVAGDMLSVLYLMDRFSLPEPSLRKAMFVAGQFAAKATYGDGSKMDKSEPKLREAWSDFQSVAHLWAAMLLNQAYPFAPEDSLFSPEYFPTFLQVSASIYEFGCTFIPFRMNPRKPILDAAVCWALPESIVPRHLQSDRRPILVEKTLKRYRART